MMVTGAGTPEVARLYERALEICEGTPTSGCHFAARWGRWRAAKDRGAGLERADDLLRLAQELGDPAHLVQAHHCQWATLYMFGAHEECCRHAEEGIRLYDPERHRLQAHLYGGHDPKVCALGERALSSWLLGTSGRGPGQRPARAGLGGVAGARRQPRPRPGLRAPGASPAPGRGRGRAAWRTRWWSSPPNSTWASTGPRGCSSGDGRRRSSATSWAASTRCATR